MNRSHSKQNAMPKGLWELATQRAGMVLRAATLAVCFLDKEGRDKSHLQIYEYLACVAGIASLFHKDGVP